MKKLTLTRKQILRAIALAAVALYFAAAQQARAQIVVAGDGHGNINISGTATLGPGSFSGYYYNATTTPPLSQGGTVTLVNGTQLSEIVNNSPNLGQQLILLQTGVGATVTNNGSLSLQGNGAASTLHGTVLLNGIGNGSGGNTDATVNNNGSIGVTLIPNNVVTFERSVGIRENQSGSGNITIHNTGTISASGSSTGSGYAINQAIRAQANSGNVIVTNTNTITDSATDRSAGYVIATAIVAESSTGNATVTNSGSITAHTTAGGTVGTSNSSVSGVYALGKTVSVTNSQGGTISAAASISGSASSAYSFGIRATSTTTVPVQVNNYGSVSAAGSSYNYGIYLGTSGSVYNTGSVTSRDAAIFVPSGSEVTLAKYSSISGLIGGGDSAASTSTLNFTLDVPSDIFAATVASLNSQISEYNVSYEAADGVGNVEQDFLIDSSTFDVANFKTILNNLVEVSSPPLNVPEPSTWAMLLGSLGVLAFWRRRAARVPSQS